MLPANLAKGRTAARGLGELLMVSPGSGVLQTLRYSPYSVPSTNTAMVAMSQSMTFSSSNPASFAGTNGTHSPLVSISGTRVPHDFNSLCHLQLFGPDAHLTMNQLLAAQLSVAGKTGFSSPPPQQLQNQFQQRFETGFDSCPGGLRTSFCDYFGGTSSFGQTVHVGI